jgi:hypothetical protein
MLASDLTLAYYLKKII